jgi:hypothetical protein
MSKFSEQALAWMRDMVADTLPQQADLYAPSYSPDGGGGQVITWGLVAGGVACRLDRMPMSAEQWGIFGDAIERKPRYRAVFLHNAPLADDMRVVVAGDAYRVIASSIKHGAKLVVHAVLQAE